MPYKATVNITCWKKHTCVGCKTVFSYKFKRTGTAEAETARATSRAERLAREIKRHGAGAVVVAATLGLAVAAITGDGRFGRRHAVQSYLSGCTRGLDDDALLNERIANDAFLADLSAAGLELRFHQRNDVGAIAQ